MVKMQKKQSEISQKHNCREKKGGGRKREIHRDTIQGRKDDPERHETPANFPWGGESLGGDVKRGDMVRCQKDECPDHNSTGKAKSPKRSNPQEGSGCAAATDAGIGSFGRR